MKKINIGVLGCANIAERSMIPAIKMLPDQFELIAVASRSASKAAEAARKFGCEAVVGYDNLIARADIDALYIPLPTGLHAEWITKALSAGKHVYAEKSIAMNGADAQAMVELAQEKDLCLMEGYMFQYHSQHNIVKDIIASGVLGELRGFYATFGFPPLPDGDFRYDPEIGGGVLMDAAGYPLRAVHFLLGPEYAVQGATLSSEKRGAELFGSAFLSNGKGVGAHIGFGFDNFYQCRYEYWGSKGKLIAERAFTPKPDFAPPVLLEVAGGVQKIETEADNHFRNAMQYFFESIYHPSFKTLKYGEILLQSKSLDMIRTFAGKM